MSYKCDDCQKVSPVRKPEILRYVYRDTTYKNGSKGREIKEQKKFCPRCAKKWDKNLEYAETAKEKNPAPRLNPPTGLNQAFNQL